MLNKITFDSLPIIVGEMSEKLNLLVDLIQAKEALVEDDAQQPIDLEEACRILMVSKPTLYRYCSSRRIRYYKQAKKLYFLRKDLDEFILSGKKSTKVEIQSNAIPSSLIKSK